MQIPPKTIKNEDNENSDEPKVFFYEKIQSYYNKLEHKTPQCNQT